MELDQAKWTAFTEVARKDGARIESVVTRAYTTLVDPAGNAVDGGANAGLHTRGLSDHLVGGQVIAVEANEVTFRRLEQATATRRNVIRHFVAIQDDPDRATVSFNCSPSHPGRSGTSRLWDCIAPGQVEFDATTTVSATTIDKLVEGAGWTRLDFIKLDLEGGEFPALRGAADSLRRFRPLVVTEHSIHASAANGSLIKDYFDWLSSMGYSAIDPSGQPANIGRLFPFWYLFLVPTEVLTPTRDRICDIVNEFI